MNLKIFVSRFICSFLCLFLLSFFSFSQTPIKITGVIKDETGGPVSGASVRIKSTNTGTTTKQDGTFELQVPSSTTVLVVSHVSFVQQEIPLNGQTGITVQLASISGSLEDVVVIGYATRRKTDVTGSVVSINSEKIRSVPTTNLTQALQGRIAGIEATPTSFRPGQGSRIRIRGNRSLTASNEPLYVVDGIPVTYSIDDMNPLDIESVDVLKDASATAIYGVRGANGVIQITTKKGKSGKLTVDYQGSVSVDNMLRDLPVFSGAEMTDMWRQAFHADGVYAPVGAPASVKYYYPSAMADFKLFGGDPNMWSGVKDAYQYAYYNSPTDFATVKRAASADERALMQNLGITVLDSLDLYDPTKIRSYPWQKEFKDQGMTNSHSITVTAGSDKIRASFSGSYFNQKGVDPGQRYIRYTVGNSTEFRATKFLTFGNSISYTNSKENASGVVAGSGIYAGASGMLPIVTPYDSAGNFVLFPNGDRQIPSPANNEGRVIDETRVNRVFGNIYAEVALFKGLKYKTVFGLDSRNSSRGQFNGTNTAVRLDAPASASHIKANSISWIYDNLLFYTFDIKKTHNFNITLLHEMQSLHRTDTLTMSAENLIFEEQKWYSLQRNTNALVTGSGVYSASQLVSYMGRVEYNYKNRYLLTLSNRYDESSVLAEGKKGEWFPSAALAWQVSNEDFFLKQNIFSYAKLRIGIGKVGNSSILPYQTNGPLQFTNYNWQSGTAAIGLAPTTFPVPDLTWEKSTTRNLGIEFGLFQNRINLVVDVYKTNTKDILQTKTIPATNGVNYILDNIGETSNKGIDISLSTININNKNGLRWTTDIVFSKNKESIVNIDGSGNDNLANLWFVGQPIRVYYSWDQEGIYQYGDTAKGGYLNDYLWAKGANKSNTAFRPGKIRVRDINGDTLIDNKDKMILGYDNANWTGSITNTISYKGFELSCMIYFRKGGMYRAPRPGLVGRFQSTKVNYWTPTNPSGNYQQPTRTSDVPTYWEALTYRDGSFTRVRNISLTYRFPASIVSKLKATNLAVYVNAINPFLFHNKSDYDPETVPYSEQFNATTNQVGPTSFSYRSFVFGIRMSL